jgi:hypothetical protein
MNDDISRATTGIIYAKMVARGNNGIKGKCCSVMRSLLHQCHPTNDHGSQCCNNLLHDLSTQCCNNDGKRTGITRPGKQGEKRKPMGQSP